MFIFNCFYCKFSGPDDAETFEMELSGFLREYGILTFEHFALNTGICYSVIVIITLL